MYSCRLQYLQLLQQIYTQKWPLQMANLSEILLLRANFKLV